MARKITLKDVAQHAGVSYQTVSKVLRDQMRVTPEVRDRIFSAVRELGYRPNVIARNLRLQSSRLIGYSWEPWRQNFFNPVLEQFQQGIVEAAEQLGYHILLFPQRPGVDLDETYRELVFTGRVDGFILSGLEYHDPRIRALQQLNVPLVAFGRTQAEHPFAYVDVDGGAGVYAAMTHLFDQGHRRIAALAWPEDSRVGQERLSGYLKAMEHAGLAVDSAWIARGTGDFEFGYSVTPTLLALPPHRRPTAIVTMLDLMALGAMRALEGCGLQVGQDVAVVGFDDMPVIQYLKPGLTSVRQPVWEVAQKVVEMLVGLLENKPPNEPQVVLMPELIVRESTSGRCPP
jgi:DNA-binding LacI/PurR family transcriptional regulator